MYRVFFEIYDIHTCYSDAYCLLHVPMYNVYDYDTTLSLIRKYALLFSPVKQEIRIMLLLYLVR